MILDSNIIIYSFQSRHSYLQRFMRDKEAGCSAITQVEVLGYPRLSPDEKHYLEACFANIKIYPIDSNVIQAAVALRQQRKMSLGDAIIAATALEYHQTLITRNVDDFAWVEGLKVINPLEGEACVSVPP